MNRNNEAHFNSVPELKHSRTRFKRDQDHKTTMDAGKLVPLYVDEVLPGDTFDFDVSGIVRMTTPIYPVMDNCYLDLYAFYTPNRIVWDGWKEFMGEASDQPWTPSKTLTVPEISVEITENGNYPEELTPLDYMGAPTKVKGITNNFTINALPIRGYCKIWNEWFRDQNVDNPATVTYDDATVTYVQEGDTGIDSNDSVENSLKYANTGRHLLPVNKFHDYFTSCLPAPQRGESVSLPLLNTSAADLTVPVMGYTFAVMGQRIVTDKESKPTGTPGLYTTGYSGNKTSSDRETVFSLSSASTPTNTTNNFALYSDLSMLSEGAAATINQLRQAFQVQRFLEQLARGGSRYRELIRTCFDVTISDKTVQIPEYLGGERFMINVSQVVQTSATSDGTPQGNAAAISVTPFSKHLFTKSFEEHGFVMVLGCIRHDRTYQQGLERMWSRGKSRLDYYFPVFAHLGEQAVLKREIYLDGTTANDEEKVFGYQEAWADYRMKPNRVSGKMRSNATGTLDSWHYADNYEAEPKLSQKWMKEGKEEIQRTLAVQDEPQFIADFLFKNKTTRCMPLYSVPGLIDHM